MSLDRHGRRDGSNGLITTGSFLLTFFMIVRTVSFEELHSLDKEFGRFCEGMAFLQMNSSKSTEVEKKSRCVTDNRSDRGMSY